MYGGERERERGRERERLLTHIYCFGSFFFNVTR